MSIVIKYRSWQEKRISTFCSFLERVRKERRTLQITNARIAHNSLGLSQRWLSHPLQVVHRAPSMEYARTENSTLKKDMFDSLKILRSSSGATTFLPAKMATLTTNSRTVKVSMMESCAHPVHPNIGSHTELTIVTSVCPIVFRLSSSSYAQFSTSYSWSG